MRMWLRKWWWLTAAILAIALVIWWEEKRCQSQAYQCRSQYAAELGSVPVDQKAAEQEAIAAACEPNGYFCRLFGPANLPAFLLVLVGIGGIWAALRTLAAIEKQADVMINSERAWVMGQIDADKTKFINGKLQIFLGSGTSGESTGTWLILRCHNEGKSPAWIYEKRLKFEIVSKIDPVPDFDLVPVVFNGREPIGIGQGALPNITDLPLMQIAKSQPKSGDIMLLYGILKYHDIFKTDRHTTFGFRITKKGSDYIFERLTEAPYNENT